MAGARIRTWVLPYSGKVRRKPSSESTRSHLSAPAFYRYRAPAIYWPQPSTGIVPQPSIGRSHLRYLGVAVLGEGEEKAVEHLAVLDDLRLVLLRNPTIGHP